MIRGVLTAVVGVNPMVVAGVVFLIGVLLSLDWARINRARNEGIQQGRQEVVQEAVKAGKKAHAKSEAAHSTARTPGAAERLQADKRTCRDC